MGAVPWLDLFYLPGCSPHLILRFVPTGIQRPLLLVITEFLLLWLGINLEMQVAWLLVHSKIIALSFIKVDMIISQTNI